jgi:dihydroorotate dehydrogenase (NAD+) catalytic subunit
MEINLGNLKLKNSVILASGTFNRNITKQIDISKLGGLITKTITLQPRAGNPLPHIIKTKYGFLNSVGLKNSGIKKYLKDELSFWQKFDTEIIPSIGGEKESDYIKLAKILNAESINAIEVNISCPNIDSGGMAFGQNPKIAKRLIKKIRKVFNKNLIVKLSPNVTSITDIAAACLEAGADILSIANTYLGLEIDNKKKKAKLHRKIGGYSGSAIKPISLRMVWEVYKKFHCPIIGGGGIENFDDVLDYIMCGATAIAIGSANYQNPKISEKIAIYFEKYFTKHKLEKIKGNI